MRNDVTTYMNDIERQLIAIRPLDMNAVNSIDKAQKYLILIQLTTDIIKKLNQLFTKIFDRFSIYIDQS